jgi:RNA polymerase sigma-70 factor (ECF subfamily)
LPLDADDITRLYDRHARDLVRFFARRTYGGQAAVDLVAETFAAAIADAASFRGGDDEAAAAWLYGIARHQLSGWYRRGDVERRALARLGLEPRGLTDAELERVDELSGLDELRGRVAGAVEELPPDQRDAVRLRVVYERSYGEIARLTGTTEQTARARVSRGLRALAAVLDGVRAGG